MLTPCARRRQQVLAARLSNNQGDTLASGERALMLMQLQQDKTTLSQIESNQVKAEAKRRILPVYDAWVAGVLEHGKGEQDDILMTVMIWRIDAGDITGALNIAAYALAHNMAAPDGFERSTACIVTEEVSEQALAALTAGKVPDADQLGRLADMTDDADMPDSVRAKLYKAIGFTLRAQGDTDGALLALNTALARNEKCGVKNAIKELVKQQGQ